MNQRERYSETLLFGTPDKLPFSPGGPRESTLKRWRSEGLPEDVHFMDAVYGELGIAKEPPAKHVNLGIDFRMIPWFEEKVLEHKDGHYIVSDWMGAITEISDKYDYTYIRNAKDFVTRKWHKFPVQTRADWENMKGRFLADTKERFPADFEKRAEESKTATAPVGVSFNGPFWQLREFLGMENLCVMFLDDPDFVGEMCDYWKSFVSSILKKTLSTAKLDYIAFSEDMAYKAHPMISPALAREYLMPAYVEWVKIAKEGGCKIIDMDSDGFIDDLIPIWIDSGINVCDPIEVAAHNDINEFRRKYGKKMAYRGGIDKRAIAAGGSVIEKEMARIAPVAESGGYLPGCDHGVPPDISWQNFLYYCKLLAKQSEFQALIKAAAIKTEFRLRRVRQNR